MSKPTHCTRRRLVLSTLGVLTAGWSLPGWTARSTSPAVILVVGDSLSAEYGIARDSGWVALLTQRLRQLRPQDRVINASISGDTTSGGRTRLPALLKQHQPTHVVIELGANDALRGFPLRTTEDNLLAMTKAAQDSGAKVVVVGMQVPPNYGKRYTEAFAEVFARVAQSTRSALVPFLLKDVADRADAKDWFQPDGLHPLAKAHPIMLEHVWTALRPLLLA